MKQPDNIVFYEDDITAPQLFQKVETVKDDVIVRSFDIEFEQFRLGFREMDSTDKNSKSYVVFNPSQLELLGSFIGLAYLT